MIDLSILVDDLDTLPPEGLHERYSDILSVIVALQSLAESSGWGFLVQLVESNAANLERDVVAGAAFADLGGVFQDQYKKGMVKGLRRIIPLLPESIGYYQNFRDLLGGALEKGQTNGSSTEHSGAGIDYAAFTDGDPDSSAGSFAP